MPKSTTVTSYHSSYCPIPRSTRQPKLGALASNLARQSKPVTVSEIEEYVNNLWYMEEDPYRYTTD